MRPVFLIVAAAVALGWARAAVAEDSSIGVLPDEIKWVLVGNEGGGYVVLEGDPSKEEPYVQRLKVAPNIVTEPHTHQQAENITVLSGWIGFGLGWTFDKSKGRVLPAGSYFYLPANTPHFAWTGPEGCVMQIHGVGPFP